jgi:hypothetical protein
MADFTVPQFTLKENLILWYLNYTNINITDKQVYELSQKYNIPQQIFLIKLLSRLITITKCDKDKIMNILQVDMNLNLSTDAYIFVKQYLSELLEVELLEVKITDLDNIKKVLNMFDKLDVIPKEPPTHIGQPLPDPDIGRPYINYKKCMHRNCNKCFNKEEHLIKHLKEFKVYTPSYHKLHEDIITELELTEDKIKKDKIKKCPSWICKEPEFNTPEDLIKHFQKLGLIPFWKNGMIFDTDNDKEYQFNKNIKLFDTKKCIICLEKKPNIIFDSCMHSCYCAYCYDAYIKQNLTLKCPMCRGFYNKIYPY